MFTLLLTAIAMAANQPAYPLWPNQFTATFNQTASRPVFGSGVTTGTFYYDFTNLQSRVDRTIGKYEMLCGLNGLYAFYNTPCTQYVSEGVRYLYYPEYNKCCNCCSAEDGCGVVIPTWLEGAEYLGTTEVMGQAAYKWNQQGNDPNIYYETQATKPEDRVMLELNMVGNSDTFYLTFEKGIEDNEVFDLPEECENASGCSWLSMCTVFSGI